MKLKITIDKTREEEIPIYAHERTRLIDDIESFINNRINEIIGYSEGEARMLSLSQISCFTVYFIVRVTSKKLNETLK